MSNSNIFESLSRFKSVKDVKTIPVILALVNAALFGQITTDKASAQEVQPVNHDLIVAVDGDIRGIGINLPNDLRSIYWAEDGLEGRPLPFDEVKEEHGLNIGTGAIYLRRSEDGEFYFVRSDRQLPAMVGGGYVCKTVATIEGTLDAGRSAFAINPEGPDSGKPCIVYEGDGYRLWDQDDGILAIVTANETEFMLVLGYLEPVEEGSFEA